MRKSVVFICTFALLLVVTMPNANATLSAPTIQTTATTLGTTASATALVNMPTGIVAGELIIVILRTAAATAHGYPANWVKSVDSTTDAADDEISIAYYIVTTVPGSTISVSQANQKYAAIAYRISGAALVSPIQLSAEVTGTSTTPDPGSLTATNGANNYIWLWLGGWAGEQTSPPASNPTSYTNPLGADSGTAGVTTTNVRVASARRALNAATENPGSWTISVSDSWTAWTVLVVPGTTASISQSITFASSITNPANHPRSLAQTVTDASALTHVTSWKESLTQTITDGSALTKTAKHIYGLSQSITDSSSLTKLFGYSRSLTQSITIASANLHPANHPRALSGTISDSSALTKIANHFYALSQSISDTLSAVFQSTNVFFHGHKIKTCSAPNVACQVNVFLDEIPAVANAQIDLAGRTIHLQATISDNSNFAKSAHHFSYQSEEIDIVPPNFDLGSDSSATFINVHFNGILSIFICELFTDYKGCNFNVFDDIISVPAVHVGHFVKLSQPIGVIPPNFDLGSDSFALFISTHFNGILSQLICNLFTDSKVCAFNVYEPTNLSGNSVCSDGPCTPIVPPFFTLLRVAIIILVLGIAFVGIYAAQEKKRKRPKSENGLSRVE